MTDGYPEVKLMRCEVMENSKKYWSNKQNNEDELDKVESPTEQAFIVMAKVSIPIR